MPSVRELRFRGVEDGSWDAEYIGSLERYAKLLGLPLLIALKYVSFWTLFEVQHLRKTRGRLTISFAKAMSETLLGNLAGDFSFRFRPGVGLHMKIRKSGETPSGGFFGQIEEAYLLNTEGEKHFGSGGVFQLLMCMEPDVRQQEDDAYVVQSFVIPEGGPAEFAHRALATLLKAFSDGDPPSWRQKLIRKQLPLLFFSPQEAVRNGLEAGLIERIFRVRPKTEPTFMTPVQGADSA